MDKLLEKEIEENQGYITFSRDRLEALLNAKLAQGYLWGIFIGVVITTIVTILFAVLGT